MERVKEKLASLRAEAEAANALAEEYEAKIKQLELEHTSKDHELLSIQIRAKNLEDQLDKTETKLQTVSADYNKAELKAEDADRKVVQLETELAEKEQYYEELLEKYNGAKSELDELARQFDEL
ncbi:kinesin family member C1 [Mucor ambiguus]|uniref:Kinesin family member C1 n=1 Tax=Mucor ambiguus TaxID=91626 RepID=A0A0C9LUC7_9FUNG|nr:kinesin family member C1 [Mucor ambiguus]